MNNAVYRRAEVVYFFPGRGMLPVIVFLLFTEPPVAIILWSGYFPDSFFAIVIALLVIDSAA